LICRLIYFLSRALRADTCPIKGGAAGLRALRGRQMALLSAAMKRRL
jgi:hypothetical protein